MPSKEWNKKVRNKLKCQKWRVNNATAVTAYNKKKEVKNKESELERKKKWELKNPEKASARKIKWDLKNPKKASARKIKWDLKNSEKASARKIKWDLKNPENASARKIKWDLKNPDNLLERRKKWDKNHPRKVSEAKTNWRQIFVEKARKSCTEWLKRNPEKKLIFVKNSQHKNLLKYAQFKAKWYRLNAARLCKKRRALYKQNLLKERHLRQQRYRVNLMINSQYFCKNKAILKSGEIVAAQKFEQSVFRNLCKLNKCQESDVASIGLRFSAKSLVVRALNKRNLHVFYLKRSITKFKNICSDMLSKIKDTPEFGLSDLCGISTHTKWSEPFFKEFSYIGNQSVFGNFDEFLAQKHSKKSDSGDKIDLNSAFDPEPKHKSCDPEICILPQNCEVRLKNFLSKFESMSHFRKFLAHGNLDSCLNKNCQTDRLGHSVLCLPHSCNSDFLFLRQLAVHFQKARVLLRCLYDVRYHDSHLCKLDSALVKANINFLQQIEQHVELTVSNTVNTYSLPNEHSISEFPYVKIYEKEIRQIPKFDCASCCMYFYRREVSKLNFDYSENSAVKIFIGNKNRKNSEKEINNLWLELLASIEIRNYDTYNLFLCKNCLRALVNGEQHNSLSIFNQLELAPVPPELAKLNDFEKIFIQKAKCFQVVCRLGAVGSKLPYADRLKALKGQVVHYPLPMSETLSSLPTTEGMPPDHGLDFILLGVPTKNRQIWQSLINVDNVKAAFMKLREINPEYKNVSTDWAPLNSVDISDDSVPNLEQLEACKLISHESMLKKVNPQENNFIFESYTVHPLHQIRPSQSDLDVYQLKRVAAERIDNREKKMDLWCFPLLFPNGQNGMQAIRLNILSNRDWIRSRLLNKDSRFRRDHQYLFYLLHQYHLRAVASGVLQSLRHSYSYNDMSAKDFVKLIETGQQQLESNLFTMFRQMRGSTEYFAARRLDLKCMIRELGPPTWFVTLSAAEYDWDDMSSVLIELNKDVEGIEDMRNSTRCVMDPVFTTRHFHHRFSSFFRNVICCKSGGPLGKIVDYFWRVEYQSRGSPHYHMLLWVENAPRIGVDSPEKVLEFIQNYVTCRLPNKDKEPLLHQVVSHYQIHRVCNSYCQRKRCVNGKFFTRCRFGFPRKPVENAVLHNPLSTCRDRSKGKCDSRLYELTRSQAESRVNDYNPVLALLWRANHDVQFVGEITTAVVNYIASYITKGEKSSLQEMWNEIDKDANLGKRLYKFAIRKLSMRECGAYEAVDTLLGHHLYEKSQQITYICARKPHLRSRQLQPLSKIKANLQSDPNSTDKYENDWINTYYPDRPDSLEDVCLYDFRKWYEKRTSGDKDMQFRSSFNFAFKNAKPRLISHPIYRYADQEEDYCYSLLLMFKPFRNECNELLDDSGKCKPIFDQELLHNTTLYGYHQKLSDHVKQIEQNKKAIHGEVVLDKSTSSNTQTEPEALHEPLEAVNAMAEFNVAMRITAEGENLHDNISKMNADQKRIFNLIVNHLQHSTEQLFLFISGAGGTGKSFLVNTLKLWSIDFFKITGTVIAITAPTGLAAYNISGMTIHRLLQLPVQHGSTERYHKLDDSICKELSVSLTHVKILVIDEVSMVSNLMLAYIHLRLNQIFNKHSDFFGGLNVIVMGDLAQLTPVCASPIFLSLTTQEVSNKIGGLCAVDLWKAVLKGFEELNVSMRQKDDPFYANVLNRLRFGYLTNDDVSVLQSRLIPIEDSSVPIETVAQFYLNLRKLGNQIVCLMAKTSMVSEFNNYLLSKEQGTICEIAAEDIFSFVSEAQSKNIDHAKRLLKKREDKASETAGIEALLKVCLGCRVMLRRNVNVEIGLVNGAVGTVCGFFKRIDNLYIETIQVKFDNLETPQAIERCTVKFSLNKSITVVRRQFPLMLSYAMTIHKSQGLSLDNVMADVGNTIFQEGMTYVALSRVKTLSGLHLINFDPSRAVANEICMHEINRLRESFQPQMQRIVINKEKLPCFGDRIWCKSMSHRAVWPCSKRSMSNTKIGKSRKHESANPEEDCKANKVKSVSKKFREKSVQWPKFDNSLSKYKVACYSNSAFQVLFSLSNFQVACSEMQGENDPVKKEVFDLYMQYQERKQTGNRRLFTSKVRNALGYPFRNVDGQQCAFEFIRALMHRLNLLSTFHLTLVYRYRCCNCGKNEIFKLDQEQMISVAFNVYNSINFQHFMQGWQPVKDYVCPICQINNMVECESTILQTSDCVILQIIRHSGIPAEQLNNAAIENFNCESVNIGPNIFRVAGAVIHFGDPSAGHYVAMVRSDAYGWLNCNDHEITSITNFPNELQNVSLLLLEKI